MNNLFSKSHETYEKLVQSHLEILMKNVLYCTHRLDKIEKGIKTLVADANLQKQVDDYFEDKPELEDK